MTSRIFPALLLSLLTLPSSLFSAEPFPKPDPAAQFAELKLYDPANNNRPWRVAREDWEGARRRVADDPAWKKWLADERAEIDLWMTRHRDRVEWIPGWSHDGLSPKDGSRIRWTEKIPGEEIEYFSTPSDPKIEITPKLKAWWVVTFRGRHNSMMNRAAALSKLTGETRYAEWAASQLDFYADNFLNWEPQRADHQARLYWQTLTEATNLVTYADTVRLLGSHVAPERLAKWRDKFFYPEVEAISSSFQVIHNIATWQRCATAQVALLFGNEAMWLEALDGKFGLRAQMAQGITSDYIWYEQSLGYNSYVVSAVLTLFTAASLHDRAALLDREMCVAENLMLSTTAMRFPDGHIPNPADSGIRLIAPDTGMFASAYRIFPTPLGLATATARRDWETLLDPPAAIAADFKFDVAHYKSTAAALPPVRSQNMETSRMAILCSRPWQVYFHYGQLTRSHSQAEALHYELYYNDTDITHDNGTVGYGSPLYRSYYTRGANHNVPLIDGEGEDLGPLAERREWLVENANPQSPLRGKLLAYNAPTDVSASQPRYRANATVTRALKLDEHAFIDTVKVETTDGKTHTIAFPLHLQGKVRLPSAPAFQPVADFAAGRAEPFKYWRDTRAADFTDRVTLDVEYPNSLIMRVTIELPGKFRLYHGNTPDIPPARRETLYVEQENQTAATITTTIAPAKQSRSE